MGALFGDLDEFWITEGLLPVDSLTTANEIKQVPRGLVFSFGQCVFETHEASGHQAGRRDLTDDIFDAKNEDVCREIAAHEIPLSSKMLVMASKYSSVI